MSALDLYLESNPRWEKLKDNIWQWEGDPRELINIHDTFNKLNQRQCKTVFYQKSLPICGHPFELILSEQTFWTRNPANDSEKYWVLEIFPVGSTLQQIASLRNKMKRFQVKIPSIFLHKESFANSCLSQVEGWFKSEKEETMSATPTSRPKKRVKRATSPIDQKISEVEDNN